MLEMKSLVFVLTFLNTSNAWTSKSSFSLKAKQGYSLSTSFKETFSFSTVNVRSPTHCANLCSESTDCNGFYSSNTLGTCILFTMIPNVNFDFVPGNDSWDSYVYGKNGKSNI